MSARDRLRPVGYRPRPLAVVARWLAVAVTSVLFLLPFYLLLRAGLASERELTAPTFSPWPSRLHWENLAELFTDPAVPLLASLLNSVIVAVAQTLGQLLFGGLAGYGLARIPHPRRNLVLGAVVATLMVPAAVTFVPSFVVVSTLGWVSDLRGLAVPGMFSALTAFLFRQHFLGFPRELGEAARLDGLGHWGVFWRIALPNSREFTAALGVLSFVGSWNAFLWPLVIGQDQSAWTVQVALSTLLTAQSTNLHELFLAATVSILPVLVVFLALQRFLVRGVVAETSAETGSGDTG